MHENRIVYSNNRIERLYPFAVLAVRAELKTLLKDQPETQVLTMKPGETLE